MDQLTRTSFGDMINRMRTLQKKCRRSRPLSSSGNVRVTIFVDQLDIESGMSFAEARDYAIAAMTLGNELDRVLLYIAHSRQGVVSEVMFETLKRQDADSIDPISLSESVAKLRVSRQNLNSGDIIRFKD